MSNGELQEARNKDSDADLYNFPERFLWKTAILLNSPSMVSSIIERGSNVNETWLRDANQVDVDQAWIENFNKHEHANNSKFSFHFVGPLYVALEQNKTEIAELLIDAGADVKKDRSLMCLAAKNGDEKIIQKLLEKGAKVNWADSNKNTPLHFACDSGHLECVKLLLERGASSKTRNAKRQSPLDVAKIEGHQKVVEHLELWESRSGIGAFISSLLPRNTANEELLQKKIDQLNQQLAEKESQYVILRQEQENASLKIEELLSKIQEADQKEKLELKTNKEIVREKTQEIDGLYSEMERILVSIGKLQADKTSLLAYNETLSLKSLFAASFGSFAEILTKQNSLLEIFMATDKRQKQYDKEKETPIPLPMPCTCSKLPILYEELAGVTLETMELRETLESLKTKLNAIPDVDKNLEAETIVPLRNQIDDVSRNLAWKEQSEAKLNREIAELKHERNEKGKNNVFFFRDCVFHGTLMGDVGTYKYNSTPQSS